MIEPDELQAGINADASTGRIIHDGRISNNMFTLGSNLKGVLWESTAVPELRVQAERMASVLLEKTGIAIE